MPQSGTVLSELFYRELVRPELEARFPGLAHAAGRLGSGSDVLGLDDGRSQDHDFGCRLNLLLDDDDALLVDPLRVMLEEHLPGTFRGWPVRFATSWKPSVAHNVDVTTVREFCSGRLGVDPTGPLEPADWLCLTGQSVLEVSAGPVFHDGTRQLAGVLERLVWYPDDLWLYVLAAGWSRVGQELPFVGRTGERGDELGSRVIAGRLARDVIHLWFMVERCWPPYPKWTGTALRLLPGGPELADQLDRALSAGGWEQRQDDLAAAIDMVARRQAALGLPTATPAVQRFFDRPFLTPNGAIEQGLREAVADDDVRRLPRGIGSVEQWSDNVDVLSHPVRRAALRRLYRDWGAAGHDSGGNRRGGEHQTVANP